MTKFVDCLVRLPNLKTLEILGVGARAPVSKALKRKYAVFPSIRELRITPACHHFIRNCPNLDDLTFTCGLDSHAPSTILSHGKGLKRIAGVVLYSRRDLHGEFFDRSSYRAAAQRHFTAIVSGCPNLREIGIIDPTHVSVPPGRFLVYACITHVSQSDRDQFHLFRQLRHLAIIGVNLGYGIEPRGDWENSRVVWRRELTGILKDSPSRDRKVLRWKVVQVRPYTPGADRVYDVMEKEELEVSQPETSF